MRIAKQKQQDDWKRLRPIQNWQKNQPCQNMSNVFCACSASHLSMLFHRNAGVLEGITSLVQGLVQRITLFTAEIQKLILIIEETWPNFLGFVYGETWPNSIHYQNYPPSTRINFITSWPQALLFVCANC